MIPLRADQPNPIAKGKPGAHRRHGALRGALAAGLALAAGAAPAQQAGVPPGPGATLVYTEATSGRAPIPPGERDLPRAVAEPFFKVFDRAVPIEGPSFDRRGNLYFLDIPAGRLLRLTPERSLATVFTDPTMLPSGTAIHKDGRIFVAGVGQGLHGRVIALRPDGLAPQTIVPASSGYAPDDLVFDVEGNFYFTDFRGTATNGAGGVYFVTPADGAVKTVIPNIGMGNGIALSPDGKVLWATEYATERLLRGELSAAGTVGRVHAPYSFTGRGPDSMRVDVDGNVYVAMTQQGRVLVFNQNGIPIGQILLPGREQGHFLKLSSLAFVPGTRELRILAWDEGGTSGTMIFRALGLAIGETLYSHR